MNVSSRQFVRLKLPLLVTVVDAGEFEGKVVFKIGPFPTTDLAEAWEADFIHQAIINWIPIASPHRRAESRSATGPTIENEEGKEMWVGAPKGSRSPNGHIHFEILKGAVERVVGSPHEGSVDINPTTTPPIEVAEDLERYVRYVIDRIFLGA